MIYVALLRGINVGGNNKVGMAKLKTTFERLGLSHVKTYINSGNIIFRETASRSQPELVLVIEKVIEEDFSLSIKVLLRDYENIQAIESALPKSWVNNQDMKCDVMFLWKEFDSPKVLELLTIKPEIEDVQYVKGALIWRVDKENVTKSGMMRLVGTDIYKKMTVRNVNTLRKIVAIMEDYS